MGQVVKSRSFLTELIIVIVFFMIGSIIIVRLFVEASNMSRDSKEITELSILSEKIEAEITGNSYTATDDEALQLEINKVLSKVGFNDSKEIYLDENFEMSDDSKYYGRIEYAIDSSRKYSKIISFKITYFYNGENEEIYTLSFNKLLKGGSNDEK